MLWFTGQRPFREEWTVGVERAVTRWYALRQMIQQEIDALQARLEQPQAEGQAAQAQERAEAEQQFVEVRARLLALGPCPKPMMG